MRLTWGPAGRGVLSALCANLIGIGLARFAYSPLIPAVIHARWFTPDQAVQLGTANLAGYLAGALFARRLLRIASLATAVRAMMLITVASFFACAAPGPFLWFWVWRLASGFTGAALMTLAAPAVLAVVPPHRRGTASGVIFMGIGIGVAISGLVIPELLRFGLGHAWLGLGGLSLALTVLGWGGWPHEAARAPGSDGGIGRGLTILLAEYALNGFGLVAQIVFLVDFVARGLGLGLAAGARIWVIYGIGAIVGPVVNGLIADRIGFRAGLRLSQALQSAFLLLPALMHGQVALAASAFVVGGSTPGVVPLVLGRSQTLAGPDEQDRRRAWSLATTLYAIGQAAGAYAMAWLFARGLGYAILFELGAASLALALAIDLVLNPQPPETAF